MIQRHTVSLATLNLGQNAIGNDGMLRLKEGLLQNHSLLRLGLVGTKLTDEGNAICSLFRPEYHILGQKFDIQPLFIWEDFLSLQTTHLPHVG